MVESSRMSRDKGLGGGGGDGGGGGGGAKVGRQEGRKVGGYM